MESAMAAGLNDDDDDDTALKLLWLEYFPEYGSLVMAHPHPQQLAGMVSVTVLGMDEYQFGLHPTTTTTGYDYLSQAPTYKVLFVGTLVDSDLDRFKSRFLQILSTARNECKGNKRSAAKKGDQGHQFTPALIHAMLIQAKRCKCCSSNDNNTCKCSPVPPKGGFTDNGQHTGGNPRNTSFPLVRSFFQWCLIQSGDNNCSWDGSSSSSSSSTLFRRCMVYLDLYIVDAWLGQVGDVLQTAEMSSFPQVRIHLDWAMTILGAAAIKFEKLHVRNNNNDNCDNPLRSLLEYAQELKKKIDILHEIMQDEEAAEYHLGDLAAQLERPDTFRNPSLRLKPERPTPKTVRTFAEKRALECRNISHVPLLGGSTKAFDVQKIYTWACSSLLRCSEKIEHAHLVIGTIERAFWERAEEGLESDSLNEQSVDVLLNLVNRYRAVVHILLTTFGNAVSRKTDVYSREVLVVWIAYCLIFFANRKLYHPIVPNMGVALKYDDLESLVLSSKNLWSIVHAVKCFLQKFYVPERQLFSQRCPEATFTMGEALSRSLLRQKFMAEQQASEKRVQKHWAKVQQKQHLVAQLKLELVEVQRCLEQAEQRRDELEESIDTRRGYHLSHQERTELAQERAKLRRQENGK
jgi:hypothetical protein